MEHGMFTTLQWWLFGLSSVITFVCYHGIPSAIHKTNERGASTAVRSGAFELFIRACGTDHIVMFAGMLVMAGGSGAGSLASWIVVTSSVIVATISAVSWYIIRSLRE